MPDPPHDSIMNSLNMHPNCTFHQPPSNNVLWNHLRPSPHTTPSTTGPMPKVIYDANEKKDDAQKEVLEWAYGDLLTHITTGTGRSLLEAFIREWVSCLRLYTYCTHWILYIIYHILYLLYYIVYSIYIYIYLYQACAIWGEVWPALTHTYMYIYIYVYT